MLIGTRQANYDDLQEARNAIHLALADTIGFPASNEEQVREGLGAWIKAESLDDTLLWPSLREGLAFDSDTSSWALPSSITDESQRKGYYSKLCILLLL